MNHPNINEYDREEIKHLRRQVSDLEEDKKRLVEALRAAEEWMTPDYCALRYGEWKKSRGDE